MVTNECSATNDHIRKRLEVLLLELQLVYSGVVVAAAALRAQRCGRDEEVARVLEFCVGGRLFDQLDRTAELINFLMPVPAEPQEPDGLRTH